MITIPRGAPFLLMGKVHPEIVNQIFPYNKPFYHLPRGRLNRVISFGNSWSGGYFTDFKQIFFAEYRRG